MSIEADRRELLAINEAIECLLRDSEFPAILEAGLFLSIISRVQRADREEEFDEAIDLIMKAKAEKKRRES